MRLLRWNNQESIGLTPNLDDDKRPSYAILSHTWAEDNSQEVTFTEVETAKGQQKTGYEKIRFCAEQARTDGINHVWVDTCCIDKTNLVELSEAITSMYRWYQEAVKCYVYLPDVSCPQQGSGGDAYPLWGPQFHASKWFTRGWTLQELLAPKTVEFYSCEGSWLGNKTTLARQIHQITGIPVDALHSSSLAQFSTSERMRWADRRKTKKPEDRAYSLLGIFDVSIPVIYGEGEKKAFGRLQREMQQESGTTAHPNVHWMVPRTANPLFTGRQELLQELEDTARDAVYCPWDRDQCRIVISGMGEQGKSEVCLQLARRLRSVFWAVLWIDVSTRDIAERSFLKAAQRLSLPADSWEDSLYAITNLSHPWLLILDNADDPETDYRDYFPDSRHGVIVMTSRNQECQQYATDQSVELPGLNIREAQDLLLKAAQISASHHSRYAEDARKVALLLQSHPLALVQAGAYVKRGHCSLADYPRIYEKQRQRLLTFRPTQARSRYGDVYATFEVSVEMMGAMDTPASQDALQLLPLFAVGGPSHFPLFLFEAGWQGAQKVPSDLNDETEDEEVELLTPWHVAHLPAICDTAGETWDAYRLVEAVNLLKAFSLVSTDVQSDSMYVSLHALVHAWARDRQSQHDQQQAWLQIGCLAAVVLAYLDMTNDQKRRVQPHIEALVGWPIGSVVSTGPPTLVARMLAHCGWYLLEQRADTKLYALLQALFASLGLERLQVEQAWIGLYHLAGQASQRHGRIQEAVTVLAEVVEIRKRTLAVDHPSRLASQHALASVYQANGQVREAVTLLEEVVEIQKPILAVDYPLRLASQHELARVYKANGQVREAVTLLEEVVEIEKRILAVDHPSRLASQYNLAIYLCYLDKREKSLSLMAEVVSVHKQALDELHPSRQSSEKWLAHLEQKVAELRLS
ncbi:hypothetical protein LTR64_008443 [Lithohypha guttulata]|uniref:uncharacterized protein n=1 Tax=Lithohypha guttulata TaxID=1690604 RepID=UPI002DDF033F|nr:hypothetical protein LTR51_008513 [Lithohypha guttulata]